jgi:hypothetical protein
VEHDGEDVTLGFEGFPWHMHANVLTSVFDFSEERTVNQFVSDLLSDQCIILVSRIGWKICDVWISTHPQSDLRHKSNDEVLEFQCWSARQRNALATTPDRLE